MLQDESSRNWLFKKVFLKETFRNVSPSLGVWQSAKSAVRTLAGS